MALCPPGAVAGIGMSLAQRTGKHVAVGAARTGIVCTGVPSSVRLRIAATGLSFRPGRAFAAADLRASTGFGLAIQDDRARLVVMRR
ncbi:hypothetical protein [Paractinoplanes durhamensis]|uniref:hypothetical protein n=1 Tax=Paractinoplanes durhamensis TaxID=113563 RepID=UPI00364089DF